MEFPVLNRRLGFRRGDAQADGWYSQSSVDHDHVRQVLEERLAQASARRDEASARFDEEIKDIRERHEGQAFERIMSASKEYTEALVALREAVKSHRDFLTSGIVPPELQSKPPKPEGSAGEEQKIG